MSMLAEQKRRTKWVIRPTKRPLWTTDSNGIRFGKQLMEKMGWSAGKGLGLNEQGIQEPLKVGFKNDTKGMGFKENLDDWIEHQDEFNILLNQLRSNNGSSAVNGSQDGKIEVISLEEKSKQSKARVHYQKFTRGKDLSKYSTNDLACILGTKKTKKEKPKPEDIIKTESKVNNNCETSFGVTTINSGSIQDYFKKKWIIDKDKASSFANADDNPLEDSADPVNKEKNCYLLNDERCIKLESGDKKSKKKKHKSSSDFNSLHVEESQLSNLDEIENIVRVEKKKKKKKEKEVFYLQEEDINSMKNEVGWLDENIPEESESLSLKTENSSNAVQNQMELETVSIEGESKKKTKEKKRTKRNVEQCTTEDVFCAEKIHDMNSKDSPFKGESDKRKKKKKNRIEKLEGNEVFENQNDYQHQIGYSRNYLSDDVSEVEPIKKKKKRRRELEKLDKINMKAFSSFQCISFNNHNDSSLNIEKKKLSDTFESEDVTDLKSQSKKHKKKNAKEKTEALYYDNQEVLSNEKPDLRVIRKRKFSDKCEGEDIPEVLPGKKKKKSKNEKAKEINVMENEGQNNNQIKEPQLGKDVSEIIFDCEVEDAIKKESVKKKKHNKEKSLELEEAKTEECFPKEEKAKVIFEEENAVNAEFVRKKRKKKNKGEKLEECEGIENKNEQSKQSGAVEETSVGMSNGVICSKIDLSMNSNSNSNERNDVLSTNAKAENRFEKLRANLFPDKAADKYFPEQGFNERVLKLIRWANISEFRGSNLRNVEGYGRQREYEKQFR